MRADKLPALARPCQKLIDLLGRPVVHRALIAPAFDIKDEVFAHYRQANQPKIRFTHDDSPLVPLQPRPILGLIRFEINLGRCTTRRRPKAE